MSAARPFMLPPLWGSYPIPEGLPPQWGGLPPKKPKPPRKPRP